MTEGERAPKEDTINAVLGYLDSVYELQRNWAELRQESRDANLERKHFKLDWSSSAVSSMGTALILLISAQVLCALTFWTAARPIR